MKKNVSSHKLKIKDQLEQFSNKEKLLQLGQTLNRYLLYKVTVSFIFVLFCTFFRAAIFRIINMLKVTITKSKGKVFTNECISEVVESLQHKVEQLSSESSGTEKIPSTMVGMKVYLLIQALLDQQVKQTCLQDYQANDVNCALATPETTHGKSKVCSMLSKFR